jgi:hypothetical protein
LYSFTKTNDFRQRLKTVCTFAGALPITHIKGDALANQLFGSKAQFIYSPMYLSNVVDTHQFQSNRCVAKRTPQDNGGQFYRPEQQHQSIFEMLMPRLSEIEKIYCPLSYGMYDSYKQKITQLGTTLFGEKFVVLDQFMPFDAYKQFLAVLMLLFSTIRDRKRWA